MRITCTVSAITEALHTQHFCCTMESTRRAARTKKSVGMRLIAAVGEPEVRVCNRAVGWPEMDSLPPIGRTEFVVVESVCRDSITCGVRGRLHIPGFCGRKLYRFPGGRRPVHGLKMRGRHGNGPQIDTIFSRRILGCTKAV